MSTRHPVPWESLCNIFDSRLVETKQVKNGQNISEHLHSRYEHFEILAVSKSSMSVVDRASQPSEGLGWLDLA